MSKFFNDGYIETAQYSDEIINNFISENEIGRTLTFGDNNPSFGEMLYMYLVVAIKRSLSDSRVCSKVKRSNLTYNQIYNVVHRASVDFDEVDLYNADLFNDIFKLLDARSTIDRNEFEYLICRNQDWKEFNGDKNPDFDIFNPLDARYELIRHMLKSIIMDARQMLIKSKSLKLIRIGSEFAMSGSNDINICIQRYNMGNDIHISIRYNM